MKQLLLAGAIAALAACTPPAATTNTGATTTSAAETAAPAVTVPADLPAGAYTIDKSHTSLSFRVSHLGFSNYTARFKTVDATLQLDPQHPDQAQLSVTIDPRSLDLPAPPAGFLNDLLGAQWLNAGQFRDITYRSTQIEMTGPTSARIHGDLTLHGITKPVVLEASFNGGYAGNPYDPNARIGFSAHGELKRSEFGISTGIPAPGTNMGVSDRVEIIVETEFSGPAWQAPAGATPQPPQH